MLRLAGSRTQGSGWLPRERGEESSMPPITRPASQEHELWHRLSELESEIALTEDLARAGVERTKEAAGATNEERETLERDLERLRIERAALLGKLGERGRSHRIQAHNDHQRRIRAALE